nr:hypothetical protein [Bacteroidota bacterium]
MKILVYTEIYSFTFLLVGIIVLFFRDAIPNKIITGILQKLYRGMASLTREIFRTTSLQIKNHFFFPFTNPFPTIELKASNKIREYSKFIHITLFPTFPPNKISQINSMSMRMQG